jgi:hypothetical protein
VITDAQYASYLNGVEGWSAYDSPLTSIRYFDTKVEALNFEKQIDSMKPADDLLGTVLSKLNTKTKMETTLTAKQKWVLDYLTARPGIWVAPHEIGRAYRKATNTDVSWYDSSAYSGFASPHCKTLVKLNLIQRNPKGKYMFFKGTKVESNDVLRKAVPIAPAPMQKPDSVESHEAARLQYNEKNGYFRVAILSNGLELYKKKNAAGGWTYYGESCAIFSPLWDECIGTIEEFRAIALDLYSMGMRIIVKSIEPTGFKYQVGQTIFFFRNNLVHSAPINERIGKNGNGSIPRTVVYGTKYGEIEEFLAFPTKEALLKSL